VAFPVTEATATSVEASATTSHTVSLPASIVSGDLLIVWFGVEHTSDSTVAWPGGWTELDETFETSVEAAVAYRIADGTEGASITVTSGQSQKSGHTSYRISGTSGNAPEAAVASAASSFTSNPPNVTPSWGAKDTLWLASQLNPTEGTVAGGTYVPASYTDLTYLSSWGTSGSSSVAERELNAASEDPDVWQLGNTADSVAYTIGVEPATPPALNLNRVSAMHFQRHYEPTAMGA